MKYVPNMLSILRILLSILLVRLSPTHVTFCFVYLICGLSDMFDGAVARKYHCQSDLGMQLDSIGDFVFLIVAFIKCVPILYIPIRNWCWIVCIVVIRVLSVDVANKCKRRVLILHTIPNKITGFLLFVTPALFKWKYLVQWEYLICIIASIAAIQELVIHIHNYQTNK